MHKTFKTIEQVTVNKNEALGTLSKLLDIYINSGSESEIKKADLISYWIKDFAQYIEREDTFDSKKLLRYSRGDVIRANFGFRVGKELGGLHFAVVIEDSNPQSADVITVVPLSSTNGRSVHHNNVDLGLEVYNKALDQYKKLHAEAVARVAECKKILSLISSSEDENEVAEMQAHISSKLKEATELKNILDKHKNNIGRMKSGSMAIINQITTISKQRIYAPKKSTDFLYGVKLSNSALDKINAKLAEKYIFKKD